MKKMIALLLAVWMVAGLCACKDADTQETDVPTQTQEAIQETTQEEIPTEESQTVPVEVVNGDLALAESCIDKSVEELYQLIGEPESADYAPSCLNPGVGEDGNLYYDGFIVYTYREGDTETVQYVEEAE